MRLSAWIAQMTSLSRRKADAAIEAERVTVDGHTADTGAKVSGDEQITLDGAPIEPRTTQLVLLHKPVGYVCSTTRQDDKPTIYKLLPERLHHLSYAGRLDADSEGLVIMTNDGQLIQRLTHPSFEVARSYEARLDKPLAEADLAQLTSGVKLDDGVSKFDSATRDQSVTTVTLHEGRNRQIRRTFAALGYDVTRLKRISHDQYLLDDIPSGEYHIVDMNP